MSKDIFKDIFKYLPAQIVPGIVAFVSIRIITGLFQPEDYGDYILVTATVAILFTIVGWLYISIIRFYPAYERDNKLDEFYNTVIILSFCTIIVISMIFSSILVLLKSHISARIYQLMFIGVPIFFLGSCYAVCTEFLRAKRKIGRFSGFSVWKSITGIGFGIMLVIFFKYDLNGLLWGSVLSLGIGLPFLWKISVGNITFSLKNFSIPLTKDLAKYGFPVVIGNLAAWILSLSDRYVLKLLRNSEEVGIYSASYGISAHSIMLLATLFALTSGSMIYNIWEKEGEKKSKEFMTKLTSYYLIVCIPAVVGLGVLAKPIITIMTGQEYHEGFKIIPLVATGAFFLGLQQRYYSGLAIYKKTHVLMFCTIASGAINLALNFLLIPSYGYIAAALTTLISYVFLLFMIVVISRRVFVWQFPVKSMLNAIFASILMGIIVYYVGNSLTFSIIINIIVSIVVGVVIYFMLLLLLKEFSREEIQILINARKKFLKF